MYCRPPHHHRHRGSPITHHHIHPIATSDLAAPLHNHNHTTTLLQPDLQTPDSTHPPPSSKATPSGSTHCLHKSSPSTARTQSKYPRLPHCTTTPLDTAHLHHPNYLLTPSTLSTLPCTTIPSRHHNTAHSHHPNFRLPPRTTTSLNTTLHHSFLSTITVIKLT